MLSNKVSEIMTTNLTTAPVTASVFEVMEKMVAEDVGRIIVTDDDVPVGIFTEKDVLKRVVNADLDARKTAIQKVMTSPVRAVREETHIIDAFGRMYRGKYRHLLVRGRRGKIIGIVSMRRILNLAVELGQGLSETRHARRYRGRRTLVHGRSIRATVHETIDLMNNKGVTAVVVTDVGQTERYLYRARRSQARGAQGNRSQGNPNQTSHDRADDKYAALRRWSATYWPRCIVATSEICRLERHGR